MDLSKAYTFKKQDEIYTPSYAVPKLYKHINYKMKFRRQYEKSFVKEKITFRLVMDIDDIIFSTINY